MRVRSVGERGRRRLRLLLRLWRWDHAGIVREDGVRGPVRELVLRQRRGPAQHAEDEAEDIADAPVVREELADD
eukprot:7996982-Alexandrium_andersonii.AAC.1